MITSELIDLFEIVRKLASSKAELDKKYFDEFIKPVWEKFSEIHENYKITALPFLTGKWVKSDQKV
jgi:hypothetical protein